MPLSNRASLLQFGAPDFAYPIPLYGDRILHHVNI